METPQVEYIPLNTHLAVFDGFVNCVRAEQEKEIIIGMMLDELQNGEPEDYGGASGLAEIKETLQAKPVEELRAELKEMVVQGEIDVSEHVTEYLERNIKPTLVELQIAVDKGETISLTDLAEAVKEEKVSEKPEKPAKAEKKPKKSIKGRIEADKAEKRANAEKSEPAPKKNKGEAEL
jgi:outer membrane biosynthesis protein TonB